MVLYVYRQVANRIVDPLRKAFERGQSAGGFTSKISVLPRKVDGYGV